MKFTGTGLEGAFIIDPGTAEDARGRFSRLICLQELREIGHTENFVQINYSYTRQAGSVRGLHFQVPPTAEIKIVKCIRGAVYDVIVDIRRNSATFLSWYSRKLTELKMEMMYIPKGFAHGFQSLHPHSELIYFHSECYSPDHEGALRFDDPRLSIKWPLPVADISLRDAAHALLDDAFKGLDV
jgi:dTDP-4-dehydrorhamnose 3,5-epimerase